MDSAGMPENRYRIAAVYQAGQIRKLIANSREPLGPADIAARLSISVNMAFRMCATMEELGDLEQVGGKYRLGMGLALIWARVRAEREEVRQHAADDLNLLNNITA